MPLKRAPEPAGFEMYGPQPSLPDFPEAEWRARLDRVQRLMNAVSVDLMVLWSEKNIRYFSGFTSTHWNLASLQPLVVLIPASGAPTCVTSEFLRTTTEAQSWIRDIRCRADVNEHSEAIVRQVPL